MNERLARNALKSTALIPSTLSRPNEMPSQKITIPFYADWLAEYLDKVGLERVNLVGHSMGALISTEFTLRNPDRVERLVLMSAAGITSATSCPNRVKYSAIEY